MKKTILIFGIVIAIIAIILILGVIMMNYPMTTQQNTKIKDTTNNPITNVQVVNAQTNIIDIKGFAFVPTTLTIKKGEKVTWTNQDTVGHTVTSDTGKELDSLLLKKGESYSHTFNDIGTYDYHCTPHPYMKAKIIVE